MVVCSRRRRPPRYRGGNGVGEFGVVGLHGGFLLEILPNYGEIGRLDFGFLSLRGAGEAAFHPCQVRDGILHALPSHGGLVLEILALFLQAGALLGPQQANALALNLPLGLCRDNVALRLALLAFPTWSVSAQVLSVIADATARVCHAHLEVVGGRYNLDMGSVCRDGRLAFAWHFVETTLGAIPTMTIWTVTRVGSTAPRATNGRQAPRDALSTSTGGADGEICTPNLPMAGEQGTQRVVLVQHTGAVKMVGSHMLSRAAESCGGGLRRKGKIERRSEASKGA